MAKSKLAKFRNKRKSKTKAFARANPETKQAIETATSIGAGFAGYAATRLLSRIAYSQAVKKYPGASSHIHVAASALSAAGVYFGSRYWDKLDEYHEAASIGAGIALIQTAFQTYMPKLGWIVSDVSADQYVAKKRSVLPDADLTTILPAERTAVSSFGNFGDFDLDALLAGDSSIEAVQIGQSPSAIGDDDMSNVIHHDFRGSDDYDSDPLEHYNGMLQ